MKTESIIQSIIVGQNLQQTFTVGQEINGRVVNRIEKYVDRHGCEFHVLDEDDDAIHLVLYLPVIVEYRTIVVDGPGPETTP